MSESVASSSMLFLPSAKKALDWSVKSWFAVALAGQWAFAIYILMIYTLTFVNGLNVTNFSPAPSLKQAEGYVLFIFFAHVLPAVYLSLLGMTQLVPSIRNNYRGFHRWNGRLFLLLGITGALSGLYLQWSKGWETNTAASLGITLNGLLILVAAYLAWFYAIKKRFEAHKRWAIHAFFLVNGVWTFRLYLMGWYMVNQGPNGNTRHIDGPMDITLSFACYLLPMLFAELYFWAKKQRASGKVWLSTGVMSLGVLITIVGVIAAATMMWAPRISNVLGAI